MEQSTDSTSDQNAPSQDNTGIDNMGWLQGFDHESDTNQLTLLLTEFLGQWRYEIDVSGGGGEGNVKANVSKTWGG